MNRRVFLKAAMACGAAGLGTVTRGVAPLPPAADRRLIIVLFGGGTRCSESIDDPQHRFIPRLWNDLVPQGTLFTNMRVEGKVVHPNSAGSIKTGHWEWDDIDWARPVAHPTIFEIYRKARTAPDTAAWAFVYASILVHTGQSRAEGFGARYAANVITPPTIPRSTAENMDRLMRQAAATGSEEEQLRAAGRCGELARTTSRLDPGHLRSSEAQRFVQSGYDRWRGGTGTTSHDVFLTRMAVECMREFAPAVMTVDFGEIDCAHYGSWSRYVDAIRRTDALTAELWQAVQDHDAYRDRTLMLILPDHGRELDRPGCCGFIHHSDFYTGQGADEGCRRVWMLALGPGVAGGRRIDRPVPITAAAATGLEFLDLEPGHNAEPSVLNHTSRT